MVHQPWPRGPGQDASHEVRQAGRAEGDRRQPDPHADRGGLVPAAMCSLLATRGADGEASPGLSAADNQRVGVVFDKVEDSGAQTRFDTGAWRDLRTGKGPLRPGLALCPGAPGKALRERRGRVWSAQPYRGDDRSWYPPRRTGRRGLQSAVNRPDLRRGGFAFGWGEAGVDFNAELCYIDYKKPLISDQASANFGAAPEIAIRGDLRRFHWFMQDGTVLSRGDRQ